MKITKKVYSKYFKMILAGDKTFELRLADWECNKGDELELVEINDDNREPTGRVLTRTVGQVVKSKDIDYWTNEEVDQYGYQVISLLAQNDHSKSIKNGETASDFLKRAVELSRQSLEAGEFPAGAVLVTKAGNVYESNPSIAYYHGECMVIDKAIKAEGFPLDGAVIYSSMESCLMCSAKMYWAGIKEVHFVIPKEATNTLYAYEDDKPMSQHIDGFNESLASTHHPGMQDVAVNLYNEWVKKIEG